MKNATQEHFWVMVQKRLNRNWQFELCIIEINFSTLKLYLLLKLITEAMIKFESQEDERL